MYIGINKKGVGNRWFIKVLYSVCQLTQVLYYYVEIILIGFWI